MSSENDESALAAESLICMSYAHCMPQLTLMYIWEGYKERSKGLGGKNFTEAQLERLFSMAAANIDSHGSVFCFLERCFILKLLTLEL